MSILLKKIPAETLRIILSVQGEIKSENGVGMYSQERTVYKIINDYQKLKEKSKQVV